MDNSRLTLEVADGSDGRAICRLDGELDLADADRVRDALAAALAQHRQVIVDMLDLAFVDSCGLRAFHEAQCAADDNEAELVFVSPQEPVLRVVRMIGFDHLRFTDDRSALEEAAAGSGSTSS